MHSGLPTALPKGFTLQPDLLFLHCRAANRQKKVGKKTLVRKMLPPTGSRTPRFSDLPTHLCVYNILIINYLFLKLRTLGETPGAGSLYYYICTIKIFTIHHLNPFASL